MDLANTTARRMNFWQISVSFYIFKLIVVSCAIVLLECVFASKVAGRLHFAMTLLFNFDFKVPYHVIFGSMVAGALNLLQI